MLLRLCYCVYTVSHSVGVRELRQQASSVLKRVIHGETVEVTDRGHPVARIVPLRARVLDQLVLDGRATEAVGDLLDLAEELGLPAPSRGPILASDALAELRHHER